MSSNYDMYFLDKLRTLRKSIHYTIANVSNMTGIHSGTIKLLKSGKSSTYINKEFQKSIMRSHTITIGLIIMKKRLKQPRRA